MPKDDIYKDYFLEPELGYDNNNLIGKEIFIPQFPGLKQIQNARGKILEINNDSSNEFTHLAKTQKGSSGSPIFLKGNNKVIGIHKEGSTIKKENYGDFIAPIISILTFDIMLEKMQTNNNISSNPQNNNKIAPVNLNNNNVINVYYIRNGFEYTVHYFYDGVEDVNKTESYNALFMEEISTYVDKNIDFWACVYTQAMLAILRTGTSCRASR